MTECRIYCNGTSPADVPFRGGTAPMTSRKHCKAKFSRRVANAVSSSKLRSLIVKEARNRLEDSETQLIQIRLGGTRTSSAARNPEFPSESTISCAGKFQTLRLSSIVNVGVLGKRFCPKSVTSDHTTSCYSLHTSSRTNSEKQRGLRV